MRLACEPLLAFFSAYSNIITNILHFVQNTKYFITRGKGFQVAT